MPVKITVFLRFTKQYNTAYFDNAQLIKDSVPSYTYNDDGELVTVTSNAEQKSRMEYTDSNLTKSVDAKGYAYTYDYDDNHNMTKATSQNGVEYNYTYNSKGQATALEAKNSDKTLALKSNLEYNNDGRFLLKLYDQDDNCDTYNYNSTTGYLDSVKDNDTGAQINYTYDENRGQLISVSQTDSYTDITAQNNYTYDESGKLLTKINHSNTDYIIDYDKFYNTTENKVGSQVLTAFDYGTNNNILQKVTYGNGQTVDYNYDKYGNVKELFYNGTLAFSFISDKTGAVMRHKDFVNNRQFDYDYDTTGRLVRQVKTDISKSDSENRFVSAYEYDYDLNNNITKLASKNADSSIVHNFTYGKDNLLTEYSSDVSSKVTYTYDGLNRLTKSSVDLTAPLDMSYTYYDSERGENFTTTKIKEENIGADTFKYCYDTNGNITHIYKKINGNYTLQYVYDYDEFNQLIISTDYVEYLRHDYEYDEAGNILSDTTSNLMTNGVPYGAVTVYYEYNDSNWGDKLTNYNGETITYDEIGNPLSYRDGMTFTWENGRNLSTVSKGNNTVNMQYDANGLRTKKEDNDYATQYYYDINNNLIAMYMTSNIVHFYYDANGNVTAMKNNDLMYYYVKNLQGDIVKLIDENGNVKANYTYDALGNITSIKNGAGLPVPKSNVFHIANINPFRYRGYVYDSETGLYYLQSRYYDPVTGRFLNADYMQFLTSKALFNNLYVYCNNNYTNVTDPFGTSGFHINTVPPMIKPIPKEILDEITKYKISLLATAFLDSKKYYIAKNMFLHSLYYEGTDLAPNVKEMIVKAALIYPNFISTIIKNAKHNTFCIDFEFTTGDLYYSLQHVLVSSTWGKNHNGKYLQIKIYDKYDFTQWRKLNSFGNIANDFGYILTKIGYLSEYIVNVSFTYYV
ncbi:RHS repeat domain-containing protein [Ruminococcus sp.]|uniref:RHS repeat domain-containing protein n=1 Tax=Ruminococcus sp. TaxID=41978 RepID=UPI00386494BA